MKYINTSQPVDITANITCPECYSGLWVEITEYDEDGQVTEGGFYIHCNSENINFEYRETHAERWQQDWTPVESKVYQWLLDNVRVADVTEDDLKVWNQAIADWMHL